LNRDPYNRTQLSDPPELRKSASGKDTRELEEAIIASQLDRLPTIFRKVFEIKSRGDDYVPERPKDGPLPKYWNNVPKTDEAQVHAFHEMAHMKQECKKHKEQIKQEQVNILLFNLDVFDLLVQQDSSQKWAGQFDQSNIYIICSQKLNEFVSFKCFCNKKIELMHKLKQPCLTKSHLLIFVLAGKTS
jgi:hypothetical protein